MLGRFVSEDPLGFAGSGPNFYSYVFDSPLGLVDPFGLESGNLNELVPGPNGETANSAQKSARGDTFSWWGTFWTEFFKFKGGPGNVPTCAERSLIHIGEEFVPIDPGGASVIQATAPSVQAATMNSSMAATGAEIDAYIATRGLTVPLRSSVVRGMIAKGAEKAVAVGAKANVAVQTVAVDYAAVKSMYVTSGEARNGTCAAAFPVF